MEMNKENTVAFVGSNTARILSDKNDANLINVLLTETYLLVAKLYQQGFRTFLTGTTDGFETIAAEAVRMFQREKTDIELITDLSDFDLQNCSQLVCYCGNQDSDTARVYECAKEKGMPAINLHTLMAAYFVNNSPAKQALQPYNHIDGFRYCKEGILLCYLYGDKPIIASFENIERVEQREDKIYVTLTNDLEVDAYILSEEP